MADNQLPASLAPRNMEEAMAFAKMLAESNFVPQQFKGKAGDIIAAIQFGAEVGLAPMQALQNIAVINGRPTLWGDAMLALVQRSGQLTEFSETNDGTTATCKTTRKNGPTVVTKFSLDDARRAGLLDKAGPWKQYPKRMLQMRARGFNLRDNFADVLKGVIAREEAQDYDLDITRDEPTVTVTSRANDLENPEPLTPEVTNLKLVPDEPVDEPIGDDSDEYRDIIAAAKSLGIKSSALCNLCEAEFGVDSPEELKHSQVAKFSDRMLSIKGKAA